MQFLDYVYSYALLKALLWRLSLDYLSICYINFWGKGAKMSVLLNIFKSNFCSIFFRKFKVNLSKKIFLENLVSVRGQLSRVVIILVIFLIKIYKLLNWLVCVSNSITLTNPTHGTFRLVARDYKLFCQTPR